jgi:hypothetical protein
MVLPTVNWWHQQNKPDFKKSGGQRSQLFLSGLKKRRLSAWRRGLAERICPFVGADYNRASFFADSKPSTRNLMYIFQFTRELMEIESISWNEGVAWRWLRNYLAGPGFEVMTQTVTGLSDELS